MATSQNTQQQLSQFNDELEKINQQIVDLGNELGENLVKKLTQTITEAKKIKDPLKEIESISKKINDIADETAILYNQEAIYSKNYVKAIQEGNKEEQKKLLTKLDQIRSHIDINQQLLLEFQTLKEVADIEEKITEKKKKQNEFLDLAKKKLVGVKDSLIGILKVGSIFDLILKGITRANEISVDLSKNFGYGAVKADTMVMEMQAMALASDNTNMTLKNIGEAMNQLGTTTGFFAKYSADTLETQIMLTKQLGLSGEEAAHIYEMSVLTGKSSSQVNDEMLGAFVNARNAAKVGVSMKQVFAEAAKVSGQLQATFAGNPAKITEAIVKVKALGTTLEQTKSQGNKLLDFASSLESELQAELLTGKQLNLERARAAALAGDQVALAEELNKNIGTYDDFSKMNVLQQESLAKAVGLTADQLAEQLKKQKLAQESGKSLAQITKEEAAAAEKRKTIQEKFNNIVEKLQDVIGSIGTILSPIVELFTFLADHSYLIYTYLGVMLLAKLPTVVSSFKNMKDSVVDMAKNLKGNVMKLFSKEGRASLLGGGGGKTPETPTPPTPEAGKAGKGMGGFMDSLKGIKTTDMIKGAAAILILSAALFVAAKAFQQFADVKWEDMGKAGVALVGLSLVAGIMGTQPLNGFILAGALALGALGLALIPFALAARIATPAIQAFGDVLTKAFTGLGVVITSAANGIATIFNSLQNVDVTKLLAIGPALIGIGVGLASLGAGGVINAIGSFLGGDPIKKIEKLAAAGDGLQKTSTGLQAMAGALTQVAAALSAIDISKLEALSEFSDKQSGGTIGKAASGITDFITAPIKAIGSMVEGSVGGGSDNTAMIAAINEVRDAVNKLYNKNQSIHMDGKTVGTTLSQGTYKSA